MHEASLLRDLMEKIESIVVSDGGGTLASIRVSVGALSHMSPEHFREHFDQATSGTRFHGARVDVRLLEDYDHPHAQDIILESVEVTQ